MRVASCSDVDLKCELCGKHFNGKKGKYQLRDHMRRHLGEHPHKCAQCHKRFMYPVELRNHLKKACSANKADHSFITAIEGDRFQCGYCFLTFSSHKYVMSHLKGRMHIGEKPFWCKFCGMRFSEKTEILNHQTEQHHNSSEATSVHFHCYICKKVSKSATALMQHEMDVHLKKLAIPVKCKICHVQLKTEKTLRKHVRFVHNKEKNFTCDICEMQFGALGVFKRHQLTHTQEKNFQCGYCGKGYSTKGCLTRHERTIHTGERPFTCAFCDDSFADSTDLSRHIRKHTGEEHFKCGKCSKNLSGSSKLKYHIDRCHGKKERRFQCEICGKCYLHLTSLRSHTKCCC